MKKIICLVATGVFLVAGAQAQTAKKMGAQEKTKLTQQIEDQAKAQLLGKYEKCDAKWLSTRNAKSPWAKTISRDNQDPRKISFMGIPLRIAWTAGTSGWDAYAFGHVNHYSSAPLEEECKYSGFSFDIKIYDKTDSIENIARGFADSWTAVSGEVSTFDNRNSDDIIVSTKNYLTNTVGLHVFRVFETASHKVLVVDFHWQGVRKNEAALLGAFFETIKKTPKQVFESHFITSYCRFGSESYCS